ncbi:hypothetical protein GJAV_G00041880 [Gymnothorax javanicus]|nr:hypothetical protein GJAV_G00041880 [Gymnothorax javanicus]
MANWITFKKGRIFLSDILFQFFQSFLLKPQVNKYIPKLRIFPQMEYCHNFNGKNHALSLSLHCGTVMEHLKWITVEMYHF